MEWHTLQRTITAFGFLSIPSDIRSTMSMTLVRRSDQAFCGSMRCQRTAERRPTSAGAAADPIFFELLNQLVLGLRRHSHA